MEEYQFGNTVRHEGSTDPRHMAEPKHSGLGIASFAISVLSGILIFVMFVVAGVMESSTPGGMDEESPAAIMLGLSLFAFVFLSLLAFVLGIAGLFQSNRKKVFAVLGLVFSGMVIFGTVGLILVGLMMDA